MESPEDYKRLNPRCKIVIYIKSMVFVLISIAILAAVSVFTKYEVFSQWYWYVILACVALLDIYLLVKPTYFYRYYRYIVSEDKVDIISGIIFRSRTLVPIERIHQVDVYRGPLSNAFGLANVTVTTAGGTATIKYLDIEVADSVASYLNDKVNRIIRDRESDDRSVQE